MNRQQYERVVANLAALALFVAIFATAGWNLYKMWQSLPIDEQEQP